MYEDIRKAWVALWLEIIYKRDKVIPMVLKDGTWVKMEAL